MKNMLCFFVFALMSIFVHAQTCTHTPIVCDDNNPCTINDHCIPSGCIGDQINCDDLDNCTTDICNVGICANTPMDCDDFDVCTTDVCSNGSCSHTQVNCDDGDACTIDECH